MLIKSFSRPLLDYLLIMFVKFSNESFKKKLHAAQCNTCLVIADGVDRRWSLKLLSLPKIA